VASTVALDEYGYIPEREIVPLYRNRRDVMVEAFRNAGWNLNRPKASMLYGVEYLRFAEIWVALSSQKGF